MDTTLGSASYLEQTANVTLQVGNRAVGIDRMAGEDSDVRQEKLNSGRCQARWREAIAPASPFVRALTGRVGRTVGSPVHLEGRPWWGALREMPGCNLFGTHHMASFASGLQAWDGNKQAVMLEELCKGFGPGHAACAPPLLQSVTLTVGSKPSHYYVLQ